MILICCVVLCVVVVYICKGIVYNYNKTIKFILLSCSSNYTEKINFILSYYKKIGVLEINFTTVST